MPGLRLSEAQVQRLCDVDAATSASALRAMVSAGFLRILEDKSYRRADIESDLDMRSINGPVESPWRRILCLVEFEDATHHALTVASHSALAYATSLGVTHRARVTALDLVPTLPSSAGEQRAALEQLVEDIRSQTVGMSTPGVIDVHVATGTSNDALLRCAHEIGADLIVLGRRSSGTAGLSQLREMLRDAPCHVLLVHPSGQAAVA